MTGTAGMTVTLCWFLFTIILSSASQINNKLKSNTTGTGQSAMGGGGGGDGACRLSEYNCDNGRCVPLNRFCDNINDCGDSSDEPRYCTSKCSFCFEFFIVGLGVVICDRKYVCDWKSSGGIDICVSGYE